ncbi:unnamed protein product [Knipowitschia caucasica]
MADCADSGSDSDRDSNSSSSSERVSTDDTQDTIEEFLHLTPHMFEPDALSEDEDGQELNGDSTDDRTWRTVDVDRLSEWCRCKHCQPLATARECLCCHEVPEVVAKMDEVTGEKPECITDHPGMHAVCLDPWGLQCAWSGYKQQYRGAAFEGPEDAKYRHIAYRQFVRWCWAYLGKDYRVVIPSCVVCCIRSHFPTPGLEDESVFVGHKYPKLKK